MSARSLHIKYILVIVILFVITALSVTAMFNRTDRMFAAEEALTSVQSQLATALYEVETTQSELTMTESELTLTQTELSTTRSELTETMSTLQITSGNLADIEQKLTNIEAEYTVASEQLAIETTRADSLYSDLGKLQINYDRMTDGYGYVLTDPTYQEMKRFISADRTDANEYVDDSYVCGDFSADVKKNANEQKIRCAYVVIDHPDTGHVIVAFNTTDKGIIYIEPQSDEEVNLQVGNKYWQCVVPRPGYFYTAPDYDDTVLKYTKVW